MNITKRIPKTQLTLLKKIGARADKQGLMAWCVGGYVRDMVLGIPDYDLDITVSGDAIKLAQELNKEIKGKLIQHKKFGTATIEYKKIVVDFAHLRKETYKKPAALPTVKPGTLKDDLARRDFTINTLLFSINHDTFGDIIDLAGGLKDIRKKIIRVLHDESFIDDPTRIFRAIRFAARFGFKIEKKTKTLMDKAIKKGMIELLSAERLRKEYILISSEEKPVLIIKTLKEIV